MSICTYGTCTATHSNDDWVVEDRSFSREDAVELVRETFAASLVFSGFFPMEEGEMPTIGEKIPQICVFHTDVFQGRKDLGMERLNTHIKSPSNSQLTHRSCGFLGGGSDYEDIKKSLITKPLELSDEICINEYYGTWKQMNGGRALKIDDPALQVNLSQWVLMEYLRDLKIAMDMLAFGGDYGAASGYGHTDGWEKDAFLGIGADSPSSYTFTFTGDFTGLTVEGYVDNGENWSVAFNTDTATTIADIVTLLGTTLAPKLKDEFGNSIIVSITNTTTTITVVGRDGYPFDLNMVVTNGTGFDRCADGTITAKVPQTAASISRATVTTYVRGDVPISIARAAITPTNVFVELDKMWTAITNKMPQLLQMDDFYVFVAANVYNSAISANEEANKAFVSYLNRADDGIDMAVWRGLKIIKVDRAQPNMIFAARPSNLHAGTDFERQGPSIGTGFDRKCETMWVRIRASIGFKVGRLRETFTNTGGMTTWHPRQPQAVA